MELVFGTRVRASGRRIGYLAGLEVDPASRIVTKIVFSGDGKLGPHAQTRPLTAVHLSGKALDVDSASGTVPVQTILWSRSVRLVQDGRGVGRVGGAIVGSDGAVQAVLGRPRWWSKRIQLPIQGLDLGTPGEIRAGGSRSIAA
jgi:hypothetical protein